MDILNAFKKVAILEGISYLLILFVAMPLKAYDAEQFGFIQKIVGWAHGILFIAYAFLLLACWLQLKWKFGTAVLYFFLSFVPFGTFWVDKQLNKSKQ